MAENNSKNWRTETQLVRGGTLRSNFDETSESIYMTSGYVYDSAEAAETAFKCTNSRYVYSRYSNPTVAMFEQRLALLEGAAYCVGTSSGMAAVFAALMSQINAGDRVVASRALFGSCHYVIQHILPKFGIDIQFVDGANTTQWKAALSVPTKAVFIETPSNPNLEIIDIKSVSEFAHASGARLIVDNVFSTPILQHPLELGADIVVYSATKHIDGQGRALGGAILTNEEVFITEYLKPFIRHTGPSMSPMNAWILLKGLETLKIRVDRQCNNAVRIAEFLSDFDGIKRVIYPGIKSHPQRNLINRQMKSGGTIVTFEFIEGKVAAFKFLNSLKIIDISNNLGDAKSLITHPATTTHQRLCPDERARLGISDGIVRLSVGLEDPQDLLDDLAQSLETLDYRHVSRVI